MIINKQQAMYRKKYRGCGSADLRAKKAWIRLGRNKQHNITIDSAADIAGDSIISKEQNKQLFPSRLWNLWLVYEPERRINQLACRRSLRPRISTNIFDGRVQPIQLNIFCHFALTAFWISLESCSSIASSPWWAKKNETQSIDQMGHREIMRPLHDKNRTPSSDMTKVRASNSRYNEKPRILPKPLRYCSNWRSETAKKQQCN